MGFLFKEYVLCLERDLPAHLADQLSLKPFFSSILCFSKLCLERDLNPHAPKRHGPQPCVYTNSTIETLVMAK